MFNEEGEISGRVPDIANYFWKRSKSGLKFRDGTREWEGIDVLQNMFSKKRQGRMQVFPKTGEGVMCSSLGTSHQRKDRLVRAVSRA